MCQPQESQQATLDHLKLLSLSAMHHVPRSRGSIRSHLWHLTIIVNAAGSQGAFNSRLKPRVSTHPRGGVLGSGVGRGLSLQSPIPWSGCTQEGKGACDLGT